VTEQQFRLRADQALEELQHELLPLADEAGLEIDLRNGVLQIVFEEPEPAKFVISPNAPVQQIWVSARSRSFKLAWSDDAGTFVLDGEQLNTLVERLAQQQLANRTTKWGTSRRVRLSEHTARAIERTSRCSARPKACSVNSGCGLRLEERDSRRSIGGFAITLHLWRPHA